MGRHFQPSKLNGLGAPEVAEYAPQAAATFTLGAPLQRDASPEFVEEHAGAATVTGILGVALQACAAGVADFGSRIQVAKAEQNIEFLGQVINAGVIQAIAGDGTHLGVAYGMLKHTDDTWYVDQADTTNVVLTVTKELPQIDCVLFKFLASAIAD